MDVTNLSGFVKNECPNDAQDLIEALEMLGLSFDGVYDTIKKKIDVCYNAQNIKEIQHLLEKSGEIIELKEMLEEYISLLIDEDALEHEIAEEIMEDDAEKKQVPDYAAYVVDNAVPHSLYEDFTHTKACAFSLTDSFYEVKNMRGVLVALCEALAKEDRKKIESFVSDPTMKGRKAPYFSDKLIVENAVCKNEQILDLNVYVWVNLSCNQIRNLIKRILKKFDFSFDDLKIYLRADYKELHPKFDVDKKPTADESDEKIGKYVQHCFERLKDYPFTHNELLAMQKLEWTRETFGMSVPLLKKYDEKQNASEQIKINGNNRYWKNWYTLCGGKYFVLSQWQSYHRERFETWFQSLNVED